MSFGTLHSSVCRYQADAFVTGTAVGVLALMGVGLCLMCIYTKRQLSGQQFGQTLSRSPVFIPLASPCDLCPCHKQDHCG